MYLQEIPSGIISTTFVKIKYDCCGKEHFLKFKDANKNFQKNKGKHVCRPCWLKSDDNPAKKKEVKEKIKKNNLEKYGTTCVLNTKENTAARVEKMFGTEEAKQKIVAKRQATSLEKYGTEHPMKNDEVKQKVKDVFQEKYGVNAPIQNPEILKKMQQTNLEKYGVKNVATLPEVQVKMAQTTLEKYGVEHYNQLPEMKEYLRNHCTQWLKESYENPWNKGFVRPEEWNQHQSEVMTAKIIDGTWKGGYKDSYKGYYQSEKCSKGKCIFRSSYELKIHWYFDNNDNVEWYDYEPFQVPYYDTESKKRHYTIDFVIKFKNSKRLLAIEAKNNYTEKSEATKLKKEAFINECSSIFDHELWSNERIKSLGLNLNELLKSDKVTLWD